MKSERETARWPGTIRPELEILLCSASAGKNSNARDRVRELLRSGLNWDKIVSSATYHRMTPVLYDCINSSALDLVSEEQLQALRGEVRASGANTLPLVKELLRLNQQFEAARIPAIPYKGPVLATIAYGNFACRGYADLDFVLPQRFIPDAIAMLQSAGYTSQFDPREAHAGEYDFAPGQYMFHAVHEDILLELHTERTLRYYPTPVDFGELTDRLIRVEIGGQSMSTFSVEDTLVMLCVHGAKHFWELLFWVFDIAQLIKAMRVDWTLLLKIAEKMESRRVLLLGLYLAHELFEASLPDFVLRAATGDSQVPRLATQVLEQYDGASSARPGVWSRTSFRLRSRDRFWKGLRHTVRLGISPTESDREMVRLPRLLAPLYIFVRPWRLLREYGWSSKHNSRSTR